MAGRSPPGGSTAPADWLDALGVEREFRAHGTAVQWAVTAYALAFAGLLLLCGRAADLLGRRRAFLAGMSLRVLASLGCGFAPAVEALVAARALQGVSAAIIAPAALSMVMNAFAEGCERNRALGIWGGIGGFGATAGLLLGGLITDTLGWQWVFWINVPRGRGQHGGPGTGPGQPRCRGRAMGDAGAARAQCRGLSSNQTASHIKEPGGLVS